MQMDYFTWNSTHFSWKIYSGGGGGVISNDLKCVEQLHLKFTPCPTTTTTHFGSIYHKGSEQNSII